MLGKNPLAISPLATLAGGTQSISIPASTVASASAIGPSLAYKININTCSAVAIAVAPALKPTLVLNAAAANAVALTPNLSPSVELVAPITAATATEPKLLGTVIVPQPDVALALAEQVDLQAFVTPQVATAEALAFDPSITPILEITIDAVTATATAVDPFLLSNLVVDTADVALAFAENASLIPTLGLDVAAAGATCVDPYLINNLSLQPAQTAQAFAEAPTVNLSVVVSPALSVANAYDLQILPRIFVVPAYAIALQQDMGLSGSIFLQYALATAVTEQINLQYSASLGVAYAQATAVDPAIQLQVDLGSPTAALSYAAALDLSYSVVPTPAVVHAIPHDPLLVYNISVPCAVATATAIDPALQLGVILDHASSVAVAGGVDLTPSIVVGPAASTAFATSPALKYNIITSVAVATAAAYSPAVEYTVSVGQPPVAYATAISPSTLLSVKPSTAMSYAGATGVGLEYFLKTSTVFASAQAIDPLLEYSVAPTTAIAIALTGSLKISRTAGAYYIDPVAGVDTNDGLSWSTAWKTMTFGATEPKIISGDFIRIAKTNDPVAIGCLWTNGSKSVTLSAPRTLGIDDCESGWMAVNGSTVNHTTSSKKQGTACVGIDVPAYAPSATYAYKTIPSVDASTYQGLSFWYRVESGVVDAGRWELCLCSDALGAVIVDRFPLPGHPAADRWMPLNLLRSGSGNLGATIQSIALYTTATPPTSPHVVLLDNIQATRVGDLNLTSLISKNGSPTGEDEGFWGIQSISGSTVLLDRDTNCDASSGFGYYGATEDVPTYIRETYKVPPAATMLTSSLFNVNNSGGPGAHIIYSGGWNTGSNVQDGQTYYDGQNGLGIGFYASSKNFISASRMSFYRFGSAFYAEGECVGHNISMPNASNCSNAAVLIKDNFLLSNIELGNVNSNGSPDVTGSCGVSISNGAMDDAISVHRMLSNQNYGISLDCVNNVRLTGPSLIANNECGVRVKNCGAGIFVEDATFDNINVDTSNESSRLTLVNAAMSASSAIHFDHSSNYGYSQKTLSHNHDSTGTNLVSHGGGLITSMATTRPGGSGLMWRLLTSDPGRDSFNPLPLCAGQVYCLANTTTTVKAWLRKDHATQANGRLAVRGRQLAGIPNNVTATLANNTGWQELSISLSPTESGVVQVEIWAEYVSGHQAVYYDQGLSTV